MKIHTQAIKIFTFVAIAVMTLSVSALAFLQQGSRVNAAPFTCTTTSRYFLSLSEGVLGSGTTRLVEQTLASDGTFSYQQLGIANISYNALAYNKTDNYLYGISFAGTDSELLRIHNDGSYEPIALLTDIGFTTGDAGQFWQSGVIHNNQYYLGYSNASATYLFKIDLTNPASPVGTRITLSQPTNTVGDYVYLSGYLWSIQSDGQAVRVDPATGTVTKFAQTAVPSTTAAWMGLWQYGDGSIGTIERAPGDRLVRFEITNASSASPTFTRIALATPPVAGNGDATSCGDVAVDLGITVAAPAVVEAGETFDVTYTVTNHSGVDSSGFVVIQELPTEFTDYTVVTPGCKIEDGKLQCVIGLLAANGTTEIIVGMTAPSATVCGTHSGRVYGNDGDTNQANNIASAQTCVHVASQGGGSSESPVVEAKTPNTGVQSGAGLLVAGSGALFAAVLAGVLVLRRTRRA